jgi:hypothetical protein
VFLAAYAPVNGGAIRGFGVDCGFIPLSVSKSWQLAISSPIVHQTRAYPYIGDVPALNNII